MCADVLRPHQTFPDLFFEREFDSPSDDDGSFPFVAPRRILRDFRSQDLCPIRVKSPCLRRHTLEADEVILPDTEYVPKRLLDLPPAPRSQSDEFTTSNVLVQIQLNEAEVTLAESLDEWSQKIELERAEGRQRMEQLLRGHAAERDEFNREHGVKRLSMTAPLVIEAVRKDGSPGVYRTKIGRTPCKVLSGAAAEASRKLSERQKREIIALDAQCRARVRHLEELRKADLAGKRANVEALAAQLQAEPRILIPDGSDETRRQGTSTKIRLSLRNKEDLF